MVSPAFDICTYTCDWFTPDRKVSPLPHPCSSYGAPFTFRVLKRKKKDLCTMNDHGYHSIIALGWNFIPFVSGLFPCPRTGALLLCQLERLFSSRETPNCHSYLKQYADVAVPLTPPSSPTSLPSPPRNSNHVAAKPDSGPNYLSPIPSFSKLSYYSIKVRTNPLCDSDSNSDSRVQTISRGGGRYSSTNSLDDGSCTYSL